MKKTYLSLLGLSLLSGLMVSQAAVRESTAPIKIGTLFSVTGPAAFLGAPEDKTAQMFVNKLNAQGGINGRKVVLVRKDTMGSPEKAVSFAKQLIEEEKVLAIIGPSTSGETLQIKALCEENRTILMSCAAAELIVNPVAKYVFKTPQKDSQAATWIFRTMKQKGIQKVAVLSSNDGFGTAGRKQLQELAKPEGIQIVLDEVYDKQTTDLTDVLTKVKSTPGVQAVINWSIVPAQSILAKNMKQIGMSIPLFQSHGFGNRQYVAQAGAAAEGILFPCGRLLVVDTLADQHPQKRLLASYKKEYESQYKEDASSFGGYAYDALLILTQAIRQAGSTDRERVRQAIENIRQLVGISGIYNFSAQDHTGLQDDAFEMLVVKDGKFSIYRE